MFSVSGMYNGSSNFLEIMKNFLTFTIIWISQNLAIPFWMVGHVHLMSSIYEDIIEIVCSLGMNTIVLIGFIIDYKKNGREKTTTP
jgi:hypothetical protein